MIPFAIYLLKVIICSAFLLGYYWVVLRNKTFHQWNRFLTVARCGGIAGHSFYKNYTSIWIIQGK